MVEWSFTNWFWVRVQLQSLVSATFVYFTKRRYLKIMKIAYYFTKQAPFVLKIFKILYFPLSLFPLFLLSVISEITRAAA